MRADVPMGHPAVVTAPEVEARLREPVPSTQVLDRYSGVRLAQNTMICSSEYRFFMSNLLRL